MLIVIEGVDASGKATQTKRLSERLAALGKKVHTVTFPDYESDSSAPVKMYLSGKLGETADSVNPYAASRSFRGRPVLQLPHVLEKVFGLRRRCDR